MRRTRGGASRLTPLASIACRRVAEAALRDAKGFGHNDFKIELAKRAIVAALVRAASGEGKP
jgi:xanthine dehydrogenase YagS FAD-binding subunit